MESQRALAAYREHFSAAGLPEAAWHEFGGLYRAFQSGATGKVEWSAVAPPQPGDVVPYAEIDLPGLRAEGQGLAAQLAWVVLNGGLGTSMRMQCAKSLVPVKGERTFLDLIVAHATTLRRGWQQDLPLLFMNSFATSDDTRAALALQGVRTACPGRGLPVEFVQHRFPRVRAADGAPFAPPDSKQAWAPPGHGNLYLALACSGTLEQLLAQGVRWVFVSNADNLGASPDPGILAFLARSGTQFAMEVTPRTAADVKGGTLVRYRGQLRLLEIAQVPTGREAEFQEIARFPAFNTNNLWLDLRALQERMAAGPLRLPLIVNRKSVAGVDVVQLETAMGAGIGLFDRAAGILVPRRRFAPVKTTDDLLVRRSDAYLEGEPSPLVPNPARDERLGPVVVKLDPVFYGSVPNLDLRIPDPPSLLEAASLELVGDVRLGRGVRVRGRVRLENRGPGPRLVGDRSVLSG